VTASDDAPFGDYVGDGAWVATDGEITVAIGRLFPFPIYVVRTTSNSTSLSIGRVLIGKRKAAAYANGMWNSLHQTEDEGDP